MCIVANLAFMVDAGTSIDDAVATDACAALQDGALHHHRPLADLDMGRDDGGRMYHCGELDFAFVLFSDTLTYLVRPDADDHLPDIVGHIGKDWEAHEIEEVGIDVDHTLQRIATGLDDVTNDAGMPAAAIEIHSYFVL